MLLRLLALLSMPGRGRPTGDASPRAWAAASEPEPYRPLARRPVVAL